MRRGLGAVALCSFLLGLATPADADVYLRRDASGKLYYSNAPAEGGSQRVLIDRQLPLTRGVPIRPRRISRGWLSRFTAPKRTEYDELIHEIAVRYGLEYALVKAVIRAESAFDRLAVSPKGALGLMQLMPATAAMHQVRNVFMPRENIEGGCRHLRMLLDRYDGNVTLAIAAYNAGEGRVEQAGGVPNIRETRDYLARVLRFRLAYLREGTGVLQASTSN